MFFLLKIIIIIIIIIIIVIIITLLSRWDYYARGTFLAAKLWRVFAFVAAPRQKKTTAFVHAVIPALRWHADYFVSKQLKVIKVFFTGRENH